MLMKPWRLRAERTLRLDSAPVRLVERDVDRDVAIMRGARVLLSMRRLQTFETLS